MGKDLRQLRPWYDGVVQVVVRRDTAHRACSALTSGPQAGAFVRSTGEANVERPGGVANRVHDGGLGLDLFEQAIDLDQQHCASLGRIAGVEGGLDGRKGQPVHHLQRGGHDTTTNQARNGLAGRLYRGKDRERRTNGFGQRQQAHGRFGDDTQRAFGPDHESGQVEARRVRRFAAERNDAAVVEHDLDAEDVVDGDPKRQAVRAASIVGDIATDGADLLA